MAGEFEALVEFERMIVLVVVTFEPVLAVDTLLGADKAQLQVAEDRAVIGVPAAQHRARDLAGHAADRCPLPNPTRRRIANPRLPVVLIHVFDTHAADPIGEIVILGSGDGWRQMSEPKLFQPGQKTLLLLTAEHPKHELRRIRGTAPGHH
jgi:hypothetical protein